MRQIQQRAALTYAVQQHLISVHLLTYRSPATNAASTANAREGCSREGEDENSEGCSRDSEDENSDFSDVKMSVSGDDSELSSCECGQFKQLQQ